MLILVKNVVPYMPLNSIKKKIKNNLIVSKKKLLDLNHELFRILYLFQQFKMDTK